MYRIGWGGCGQLVPVCRAVVFVTEPPYTYRIGSREHARIMSGCHRVVVNYPALPAPDRLAAVDHSLRAGLYRNDILPHDPVHGRGPASSYRPRRGRRVGAVLRPAYRSRAVDCPAGLLPGVLALYPNLGTGIEPVRGRRPRVQGPRPGGLGPQMPVYSWHLPTPACARTAVPEDTADRVLPVCERASFPPCRSLRSRLKKGAPRYRLLITSTTHHPHTRRDSTGHSRHLTRSVDDTLTHRPHCPARLRGTPLSRPPPGTARRPTASRHRRHRTARRTAATTH